MVFSQFTSFLDLVEEGLKAAKLRSVRLDGSMSRKEREASVRQFHDRTRHCVFVISLKAGGTGLNLVSRNPLRLYCPTCSYLHIAADAGKSDLPLGLLVE